MQYLLTQQEFDALNQTAQQRTEAQTAELQALCTLAAQHIPIEGNWYPDKTPRPWGCILGPKEQSPGYCDDCPCRKLCPHKYKELSQ